IIQQYKNIEIYSPVDDGLELSPLQNFLNWCNTVGLVLSDKPLSLAGVCERHRGGEVLFTIPRSALLHQGTTQISALLEREKRTLQSSSGWVPLLLTLLYEYTSTQSHWKPYLSLWTDFRKLDHPMFWSKEERDRLLRGTGIPEAVDRDLTNIQREYTDVVLPFITKHPDLWNPQVHTLERYTQLVAFVMAYRSGRRDPEPPMMVPMADMLNHISNHNANLEFTPVGKHPTHHHQQLQHTNT
uniref:SET domain containing 6, protein lysine methyltransferase n=1 Tax=Sphaeramia orbicularis TaxID=375764 RepID=A0A672YBZ7_9TELE